MQQSRNSVSSSAAGSSRSFGSLGATVDPELTTLLGEFNKAVQVKQSLEGRFEDATQSPQLGIAEKDLARRRKQLIAVADKSIASIDLYLRAASQNLSSLNQQISGMPSVARSMTCLLYTSRCV